MNVFEFIIIIIIIDLYSCSDISGHQNRNILKQILQKNKNTTKNSSINEQKTNINCNDQ